MSVVTGLALWFSSGGRGWMPNAMGVVVLRRSLVAKAAPTEGMMLCWPGTSWAAAAPGRNRENATRRPERRDPTHRLPEKVAPPWLVLPLPSPGLRLRVARSRLGRGAPYAGT